MQQAEEFSMDRYLYLLETIDQDIDQIKNHDNFIEFSRETTKIFMQMGGILKKAFEDIKDKCNIIERNFNLHKEIHQSLIGFIMYEQSMDLAKHNGENNDHLKNTDDEFYYKYESTARTVLRIMWFFDFVYAMVNGLIQDKNKGLGSVCQNAYNEALSQHHPFTIRMAVKAGLLIVGSREQLYQIMFKKNEDIESTLIYIKEKIGKIKQRLWELYKTEKMCDLT